jgi:hypothetical protein
MDTACNRFDVSFSYFISKLIFLRIFKTQNKSGEILNLLKIIANMQMQRDWKQYE